MKLDIEDYLQNKLSVFVALSTALDYSDNVTDFYTEQLEYSEKEAWAEIDKTLALLTRS